MNFVPWKDRKPLATALRAVYKAINAKAAEAALMSFEASEWGQRYPAISKRNDITQIKPKTVSGQ